MCNSSSLVWIVNFVGKTKKKESGWTRYSIYSVLGVLIFLKNTVSSEACSTVHMSS